MLLRRTTRVFRPRALIGFAVFCIALFASLGLTKQDVWGIVRYVPAPEDVTAVSIGYGYKDYHTEDLEEIQDLTALHTQAIVEQEDANHFSFALCWTYTMKNGTTVQRQYHVPYDSTTGQAVRRYFSKAAFIFDTTQPQALVQQLKYAALSDISTNADLKSHVFSGDEAAELMTAILADCEAGTMAQRTYFHVDDEDRVTLDLAFGDDTYVGVHIWRCCENTWSWLERHGAIDDLDFDGTFWSAPAEPAD